MRTTEADLRFTQPIRQIVLMLIVTALVATGLVFAFPVLKAVFMGKPLLNGFVGLVFVFGILTCFWQIAGLAKSVSWIRDFVQHRPGHEFSKPPRLLAPLAALLRSRGARMQISPSSSRSILDSVATRIDEAHDITRYLGNLLIFLGLLGTFYGLATTVPAMPPLVMTSSPLASFSSIARCSFWRFICGRIIRKYMIAISTTGNSRVDIMLGAAGAPAAWAWATGIRKSSGFIGNPWSAKTKGLAEASRGDPVHKKKAPDRGDR